MALLADLPALTRNEPFRVLNLRGDDPTAKALLYRFLDKHGLPHDTRPAAINWFALSNSNGIAVVFGLGLREDGGVEGTDFYADSTRDGVRAVYEVLSFFKLQIDAGRIPYAVASTFAKNTTMRRRFERVFGMNGPASVVYLYGKAPHGRE